jgi:adenine/guanine phosphoribosyltransferase-like PRPP-binding protein
MIQRDLKTLIRDIPDFPKPGILFRDITPLLADPSGLALSVELLANPFRGRGIPWSSAPRAAGLSSARPSPAACRPGLPGAQARQTAA